MTTDTREQRIREKLLTAFMPLELLIEDEGHKHVGHAGAAGGLGHFRIRIVAEAFRGQTTVSRHRRIYAALGELMRTDIHALSIDARPPDGPAQP